MGKGKFCDNMIIMKNKSNLAFIDGQNLHLGTMQNGWKIDYELIVNNSISFPQKTL